MALQKKLTNTLSLAVLAIVAFLIIIWIIQVILS